MGVPLLLIEIILVMKLPADESKSKATSLGVASALMIILGYPGELVTNADSLGTRWSYWGGAMIPFVYIVYTLLIGLGDATNSESDPHVRDLSRVSNGGRSFRGVPIPWSTSSPCWASRVMPFKSISNSDTPSPILFPNVVSVS